MISFFDEFVDPSSPSRAKLAVHMHALGKSKASTEATTPAIELAPTADVAKKMGESIATISTIVKDGVQQVEDELKQIGLIGINKIGTITDVNGVDPIEIKDVRQFKSSLAVTPGAVPVKDISEFEELESKL